MKDKNLMEYVLPGLITLAFLLALWPVLQKLGMQWEGGDNNYCFLTIPLFAYLCWDCRFEGKNGFQFGEFTWSGWGIFPMILSILIIIAGELGSVETLMYFGLWGCVVAIAYLIFGRRIRQMAFPLMILAFIVPLPPYINRMLTFQLKLVASSIATVMLRVSGVSVFQDGNIIDLGITQLQVVEACSGLRYLMPLFLLALLIGYFFSRGWWRNGFLVLLVVPLSVFFNALRIWMSGLLTVKGHPELVENFFHDFSGWVIFMIAGAILFGVTRIINRIGAERRERIKGPGVQSEVKLEVPKVKSENRGLGIKEGDGDKDEIKDQGLRGQGEVEDKGLRDRDYGKDIIDVGDNRAYGIAKPLAYTVIACLLFVGSGYALKKIPSATNLPERQSFQSFPINIGQWEGRRSYIPQEILDQLWADDYVQASFVNPHTRNAIHLLIPFYEWQGTRHTIHAPQSCLLGGGWALTGSKERMVAVEPGREIPVMTLKLEKGNAKILGSYFFFQRGRVLTSPWLNKAYLMWDAFTKRRTDGALVRAELVMTPGQSHRRCLGKAGRVHHRTLADFAEVCS